MKMLILKKIPKIREEEKSDGEERSSGCCYVIDRCGCYVDPCCYSPSYAL